jgi:hypothetical protein
MSRLRLTALLALALALALPGAALAATVDVGGTVTASGGGPAGGVEVVVLVQGSDQLVSTTTDAEGAWAVQVDAETRAVLEISATGPTTRSEPDERGCVTLTTATGRVTGTIEALPLAAIDAPLDGEITGQVCSATATPDSTPAVTPPSTDASFGNPSSPGSGTRLVILLLAGMSSLVLAATRRRSGARPSRLPR